MGKLQNPALAGDYAGCNTVTTTAKFWNSSPQAFAMMVPTDGDHVVFQVSDPAVGEGSYIPVKVPKAASDLVFTAKKGDMILLRGVGTIAVGRAMAGMPAMVVPVTATTIEPAPAK